MKSKGNRKFQRSNELNGESFSRELSPLAVTQGVVVNRDRSLGYGFRLDPPYTCLLSDEALIGIYQALAGFLNALPDHFDLQVIWTQHSRSTDFAGRLVGREFSPGLVGEVQREQEENLLASLRAGKLRWMEAYLILIRKLPSRQIQPRPQPIDVKFPRSILRRLESVFADARERFRYDREQFAFASAELLTHARTLAATLDHLGWQPESLDDDGVARLFFQRWNPRQFEGGANPRPAAHTGGAPLIERFAHSVFRWDPLGAGIPVGMAELDGWFHAVLTLYEPPEELARPAFDQFLLRSGLFRAEMIVNVERGDRLKRMQRLKTLLRQRESDPQASQDPTERAATLQLNQELEEMGANSEATWRLPRPWRWPGPTTRYSYRRSGRCGPTGARPNPIGRRTKTGTAYSTIPRGNWSAYSRCSDSPPTSRPTRQSACSFRRHPGACSTGSSQMKVYSRIPIT